MNGTLLYSLQTILSAGFRILLAIPAIFALLMLFSFTSLDQNTTPLKNKIFQPTMQAVQSSLAYLQTLQQKTVTTKPIKDTIKLTTPVTEKPLIKVDHNPEFKGGLEAMFKYLRENMTYPTAAKTEEIQGTVFVQFVVSKIGKISDAKIIRGIGGGCDEEALRVVMNMPDWIPGRNKRKDVAVMVQLPLKFQLANISQEDIDDKPLLVVEQNPEFKGGYNAMENFLKNSIKYPDEAKKSGIQGTVFVQFVVNKFGKLSRIKVLRGIGGGCDEEAIRVVNSMPDWIPGKQSGKAVPVMFMIQVRFQLAKNK
jgi:TonB family protein